MFEPTGKTSIGHRGERAVRCSAWLAVLVKTDVRHAQQSAEIAPMKMLQNVVLVPDRPESPNLVKHDREERLANAFSNRATP